MCDVYNACGSGNFVCCTGYQGTFPDDFAIDLPIVVKE
jgi:hypothetical protein